MQEFDFYIIFAVILIVLNTYFYYKYKVVEGHNCRKKRDRIKKERREKEKIFKSLQKDYNAGVIIKNNLENSLILQKNEYNKLNKNYEDMIDVIFNSEKDITQSKFLNDFIVGDYENNVRYLKNVL